MNRAQLNASGTRAMNEHPELWNMPWHARLKNLAEVAAVSGEFCFRVVRAQSAAGAQNPMAQAGSWLGRARRRATPIHLSGR
jgi:hypothetical protein